MKDEYTRCTELFVVLPDEAANEIINVEGVCHHRGKSIDSLVCMQHSSAMTLGETDHECLPLAAVRRRIAAELFGAERRIW